METEEEIAVALDKAHIKALRNADTLVWCHFPHAPEGDMIDFMRAIKEHDPGDGFGKRELVQLIPMGAPRCQTYDRTTGDNFSHGESHYKFGSAHVRTFLDFLRVGDVISGDWTIGNQSENLREAGLTIDEFAVAVTRRQKRYLFKMDYRLAKVGRYGRMRFSA